MSNESDGSRRWPWGVISKLSRAATSASRGITEPLERRVLLSGALFTASNYFVTSDYFPINASQQLTYTGTYGPPGSQASATDVRTVSPVAGGVSFSDSITVSGMASAVTQTQGFQLNANGLSLLDSSPSSLLGSSSLPASFPLLILDAVARVGVPLSYTSSISGAGGATGPNTLSADVIGPETIVLPGNQSIATIEVEIDHSSSSYAILGGPGLYSGTGKSSSESDYDYKFWLAPGLGIVQYSNTVSTSSSYYANSLSDPIQSSYQNAQFFALVPPAQGFGPVLAFGQQPVNVAANDPISPAITVAILNADGSVAGNDNSVINLSDSADPGAIGGITSVQAVNGVATFDDVVLTAPGEYSLNASDGAATAVTSANFQIFAPGTTSTSNGQVLAFGQQPGDVAVDYPMSPAITVDILNAHGGIDDYDNSVINLSDSANPGAIGGITSVQAVDGVATFGDVVFTAPGEYSLTANNAAASSGTSANFQVFSPGIISMSDGQVDITGTPGSDTIAGGTDPSEPGADYYLIQTVNAPTVIERYPASSVSGVEISGDPSNADINETDNDLINLGGANFAAAVSIFGGDGSDTIIGQQGPNMIETGVGSSHDLVEGGPGNDSITSQGSSDTLRSGGGTDTIRADTGNNLLAGGKNGSELFAGGGYDTLMGGLGNSTLTGGTAGGALMIGGFGNDSFAGTSGNDTIIAGSGVSTGNVSGSADFLDAGWDSYLQFAGQAALPAPLGSDSLTAEGQQDTLAANTGAPTLDGLTGGSYSYDVNDPAATLNLSNDPVFVAENDTIASAVYSVTVHLTIQVVVGGVATEIPIPQGVGSAPSGISAARTIDADGTVVFQAETRVPFRLADFFNHWGVNFDSMGIGQFIANPGSGHTLSMSVNGTNNTEYGGYIVEDGNSIVITFTE